MHISGMVDAMIGQLWRKLILQSAVQSFYGLFIVHIYTVKYSLISKMFHKQCQKNQWSLLLP